jgi:hypothetical protein
MIRFKFCFIILVCFNFVAYSQQYKWSKFSVDGKKTFHIESENEVVDLSMFNEPPDTIRASLVVNNNSLNTIVFTKARREGNKLVVLIHDTNEAYHHEFEISIVKDKYFTHYKFLVSGESDDEGLIIPHESSLVLNSCKFKRGNEIRGYIQFKGKCAMPCNEEWITVDGNFKAIIK